MRNSKFLMPVLAFVMAVGMAFTTNEDVQSNGWIVINGVPTQLDDDPCTGSGNICEVRFDNDPLQRNFRVYTDETLETLKSSSSAEPYVLPEMPH